MPQITSSTSAVSRPGNLGQHVADDEGRHVVGPDFGERSLDGPADRCAGRGDDDGFRHGVLLGCLGLFGTKVAQQGTTLGGAEPDRSLQGNWQRCARYACIVLPIRVWVRRRRGIGSVVHDMRALCCQFEGPAAPWPSAGGSRIARCLTTATTPALTPGGTGSF